MKPTFLVVDKPAGITSHDVVAAVRAVTGAKKVGHTGTLDPFATGVLPLALGGATRLIQYLDESLKVYDATISLGSNTDTGDPTGTVIAEAPVPELTEEHVREVLTTFVGPRMQTPPAYSAVKKDGKALYKYARAGEKVEVPARPITIYDLQLTSFAPTEIRITIDCSRGTYARVLANEIAEALGTVGHLSALGRLRSGPFGMEEAIDFDTLSAIVSAEEGKTWREVLIKKGRAKDAPRVNWNRRDEVVEALGKWFREPIQCMTHLGLAEVDTDMARRVKSGGPPPAAPSGLEEGGRYLVVDGSKILAIAEVGATQNKVIRTF